MNKTLNLSECIFFCFHTFAVIGDMKLEKEEMQASSVFLKEWIGNDEDLLQSTIESTLSWTERNVSKDVSSIRTSLFSIALHLNENFNEYQKEKFLMHIRLIAKADGEFHPQEIELHNELCGIFNVEIQVTESDLRKNSESNLERVPVGFKQSANS